MILNLQTITPFCSSNASLLLGATSESGMSWGMIVVWLGIAILSLGLLLFSFTRWGQSKSYRKAFALSLLAHVVLILTGVTARFVLAPSFSSEETGGRSVTIRISRSPEDSAVPPESVEEATPEEQETTVAEVETPEPVPVPPEPPSLEELTFPVSPELITEMTSPSDPIDLVDPTVAEVPLETAPDVEVDLPPRPSLPESLAMSEDVVSQPEPVPTVPVHSSAYPATNPATTSNAAMTTTPRPPKHDVSEWYQLRLEPNRAASLRGATNESEQAVKNALAWLAANQSRDGRWDADFHGGGRDSHVTGEKRTGAGARADAGITGLALLAFLGTGQTHQQGDYTETVRNGLNFLIQHQTRDGCMAGDASNFARMYCHAMATIALCESYSLSGDTRLRESIQKAVQYTVDMQSPTSGGWRYNRDDDGDTSQFGWQLLVIRSAEEAGLEIPSRVKQNARRYLASVSYGHEGGLAHYREGYEISRPMTAEALLARFLLGEPLDSPPVQEATAFVMEEPPGAGEPNYYYWYYATLALAQQQNQSWRTWNASLQRTLISHQETRGLNAGCFPPDTTWGAYGGRVYTTALAALCLEASYRCVLTDSPVVVRRDEDAVER
jgi:hypothetical protein